MSGLAIQYLLSLLILLHCNCLSRALKEKPTELLDQVLKDYDSRVRPGNEGATIVELSAHIIELVNIDEYDHEITVTLNLNQHWDDSRIKLSESSDIILNENDDSFHSIWQPDTSIVNQVETSHETELLRLKKEGHVQKSSRVGITVTCHMTFGWFPYDRHRCSLEFDSYGQTSKEIVYKWVEKNPITVEDDACLSPMFWLAAVNASESKEQQRDSGNFSRISLELYIIRRSMRYVPDYYFPAIALTLASIFTLWSGTSQARILTSLSCLIGMIIFMILAASNLPRYSHQTALDHYLFLCVNLILNTVIVNFMLHKWTSSSKKNKDAMVQKIDLQHMNGNSGATDVEKNEDTDEPQFSGKCSRFMYINFRKTKKQLPIIFLVINIIYWMVVLIGSKGYPQGFTLLKNQH